VKLAARGHSGAEPAVATKRFGKLMIVPLSKIVVIGFRIFGEEPLDQISIVIKNEDDRLKPKSVKLTHFLRRQLMRALARDENGSTLRRRQGHTEGRRRGPTDRSPERLVHERRSFRHLGEGEAHGGRSGLGDEQIARSEHLLPAWIEILDGDLVTWLADRVAQAVDLGRRDLLTLKFPGKRDQYVLHRDAIVN